LFTYNIKRRFKYTEATGRYSERLLLTWFVFDLCVGVLGLGNRSQYESGEDKAPIADNTLGKLALLPYKERTATAQTTVASVRELESSIRHCSSIVDVTAKIFKGEVYIRWICV